MISIINANIVNEGHIFLGHIKTDGDIITEVAKQDEPFVAEGEIIDAQGAYVMPGVIDGHVHFRDPGLTAKADMSTETRAAAAGGVTSFFDMPNTKPQTTTIEALKEKYRIATEKSLINYAFYLGATNDNIGELRHADAASIPAIKIFMGASTGNMLVDRDEAIKEVFALAAERHLPVVSHCEDSQMIADNEARIKAEIGEDAGIEFHPIIRNEAECLASTMKALSIAQECGTRLLVAHISTAAELDAISSFTQNNPSQHNTVKAEGCVSYLYLCDKDYPTLGGRMKCNPAIKTEADRTALRKALTDGRLHTIATDHAPHLLADKQGGVFKATSGMPSLQFSLVLMMQLAEQGVLPIPQVAQLMSHNPATYYGVRQRGFIRKGYKADLAIVGRTAEPHTITDSEVLSRCAWTPFAGMQTNWHVETTICNGTIIYTKELGIVAPQHRGEKVEFNHADN